MDFLSSSEQCLWVGNHAQAYFPKTSDVALQALRYEATQVYEGPGGFLVSSLNNERIACAAYTPNDIIESINKTSISSKKSIVIGDPSEWIVASALRQFIEQKTLVAVFFIYPVGMAALDSRKELAQLILLLKAREIPTYLLRIPNDFFQGVEPNLSSFVRYFYQELAVERGVEYLCGMPKRLKGK